MNIQTEQEQRLQDALETGNTAEINNLLGPGAVDSPNGSDEERQNNLRGPHEPRMSDEEIKQRESNQTSIMLLIFAVVWLAISLLIMTSSNKYYE